MNAFGGMLTERWTRKSPLARTSSQARACGTRAFIASHVALVALRAAFRFNAIAMISRSEIAFAFSIGMVTNATARIEPSALFISSASPWVHDLSVQLAQLTQLQIVLRIF